MEHTSFILEARIQLKSQDKDERKNPLEKEVKRLSVYVVEESIDNLSRGRL